MQDMLQKLLKECNYSREEIILNKGNSWKFNDLNHEKPFSRFYLDLEFPNKIVKSNFYLIHIQSL